MKKLSSLFIFLCLVGCASKEPSSVIAENVKSDIIVVEKQLDDLGYSLSTECKNSSINGNLTAIRSNLKTITSKVDSIKLACNTEKEVLKQENSKLKLAVGFLIIILVGSIYLRRK